MRMDTILLFVTTRRVQIPRPKGQPEIGTFFYSGCSQSDRGGAYELSVFQYGSDRAFVGALVGNRLGPQTLVFYSEAPGSIAWIILQTMQADHLHSSAAILRHVGDPTRSEERRVGKECRSWWSAYD